MSTTKKTARQNNKFKGILKISSGSVLIMAALLMPVIILLTGMIVDIGRAFAFKAELNRACMVASEEATKQINMEIAQKQGENELKQDFDQVIIEYFNKNIYSRKSYSIDKLDYDVIGGISDPKYIRVTAQASVACFFLKLIGINNIEIHSDACGRLRDLEI